MECLKHSINADRLKFKNLDFCLENYQTEQKLTLNQLTSLDVFCLLDSSKSSTNCWFLIDSVMYSLKRTYRWFIATRISALRMSLFFSFRLVLLACLQWINVLGLLQRWKLFLSFSWKKNWLTETHSFVFFNPV
jgi:hypothetical protein